MHIEPFQISKGSEKFYWLKCYKDVQDYVKSYLQCQLMKSHRPKGQELAQPLPVPEGQWLNISMDFVTSILISERGCNIIMVIVNRFSKRSNFIAAKKTYGSSDILDAMLRFVFSLHGFPVSIVSNRDIRFNSKMYKELTERLGIKLLMSTSNHPQTDSQPARVNRTLGQLFRFYCHND